MDFGLHALRRALLRLANRAKGLPGYEQGHRAGEADAYCASEGAFPGCHGQGYGAAGAGELGTLQMGQKYRLGSWEPEQAYWIDAG